MSDTYTKLFSSITESTAWGESYPTRMVWVTMLPMSAPIVHVYDSVPMRSYRAKAKLQEAEAARLIKEHAWLSEREEQPA